MALLWFPFVMFSEKEDAPKEDQGVVFGVVQTSPNSTLDQNVLFARQVNEVFKGFRKRLKPFRLRSRAKDFQAW